MNGHQRGSDIIGSYMVQSCEAFQNRISNSIPFFDNVKKRKCGKLQNVERRYRLSLEANNKTEVITMDNKNAVVVKREWVEVALDIIRFFFQHSTVEFDGISRKAKIKYHGPNGWNLSVDTSFDPSSQLRDGSEVLEQWQD